MLRRYFYHGGLSVSRATAARTGYASIPCSVDVRSVGAVARFVSAGTKTQTRSLTTSDTQVCLPPSSNRSADTAVGLLLLLLYIYISMLSGRGGGTVSLLSHLSVLRGGVSAQSPYSVIYPCSAGGVSTVSLLSHLSVLSRDVSAQSHYLFSYLFFVV